MKRRIESVGLAIVWLVAATMAQATEYGWDGGGDGANWSSGNNWSPNAPAGGPGSGDIVHHNTVNQTATITVDQNVTIANARVKWDGAGNPVTSYWTANWTDDGAGRTVSVTQSLEVMRGNSSSTGGYAGITATLNLSNLHLAIGTASQRAALEVAQKASSTVNEPTKGNLIVSGGSVTAYLNHFILGRNMGGAGTAAGTVNLSNCEDVMIDLAGTAYAAYVASGQVSYNVGAFHSGGGSVNVSGNLVLSDSRRTSIDGAGSSGRLHLKNTTFTVGGQALFYGWDIPPGRLAGNTWERRWAQVYTTVAGSPSGLDLANSNNNALTFYDNYLNKNGLDFNLIQITFTADPTQTDADNWYWGMRWKGDHESVLEGYRGETYARLKLDVSGLSDTVKLKHLRYLKRKWPGTYGSYTGIADLQPNDYIVFDDDAIGGTGYTYVGACVLPPAGTVFMLR